MPRATWNGTVIAKSDDVNRAAAWYYPETKPRADEIRGRIAFWNGVQVEV